MRDNVTGGALTETTFLVLLSAYRPIHGYGIMQFAEKETGGRVALGAGTLYGAINTLVSKGWLAPTGEEEPGNSKKVYVITELGRETAEKELHRLGELYGLASRIMGGER